VTPARVDPADLSGLVAMVAVDRLATYLAAGGGDQRRAIRLYSWNVEVSAAMWGPLHALEVSLRTDLQGCLSASAGRADWWRRFRLFDPQSDQVAAAARAAEAKHGPARQVGDVVSELSLGFWTGLLANRYHARLWEPALHRAFPLRPARVRRGDLHARLQSLRGLRNCVAHHEPVFGRDLARDHQDILTMLAYLNADAATWVASHSRVPAVLARRAVCVAGTVFTSF
jgi:hypothetical protein